ncbi:MAG: hypothetical protein IJY57_04485 [Clostridia bacterium]|nr:hypothetical protein [Clostridia bacterium]
MKLLSCYIRHFGAINDFHYDFNNNLNVVMQDNGWGKTTFTMFLKSMFYGLIDTTKKNLNENPRKKYYTWNSIEKIGGYVDFEWGEHKYRIERYFGLKAKDDTVRLTDLNTGKDHPNTDNLGKRLFKVDEEGFSSTVFFGQNDLTVKNNSSITSILSKNSSDQTNAFDKALTALSNESKKYKYARGGLIEETEKKIFDCQNALSQIATAEVFYDGLNSELKTDKEEESRLKKLLESKRAEKEKFDKAESIIIKNKLFEESKLKLEKLTEEKKVLQNKLGGTTINNESVNSFAECVGQFNDLDAKINLKTIALEKSKNQITPTKKGTFDTKIGKTLILLVSVIMVALGVALAFTLNLFGGIVLTVFGLFLTVFSLIKMLKSRENVDTSAILGYENAINELNEFVELRKKYEQDLRQFLSKMHLESTDFSGAVVELKSIVKDIERLNVEIEELTKKCQELKGDGALLDNAYPENYGAILTQDISILERKLSDLQTKITRNEASKVLYEEKISKRLEIENQYNLLVEELQQYKERYDLIVLTTKYLLFADEKMKTKYRQPLEEKLNEYFKLINGSEDKVIKVDVDLTVSVEDNGLKQDKEYYSEGYKALMSICERIAIIDMLYEEEKPFIVLDDPFVNLDGEKLNLAFELVKTLSNSFQIVYMTCHESRDIK